MTEYSFVVIVVGMIITVPLGNAIGGHAGDIVIESAYDIFEECKKNPSKFWLEYCNQIKENFDDTIKKNERNKGFYQLIGIMIPLGTGVVAIVKKLS